MDLRQAGKNSIRKNNFQVTLKRICSKKRKSSQLLIGVYLKVSTNVSF